MQIRKLSCGTKRQILLQCLHSNQEMKKLVLFATLQIILTILQRQWLKVFLHMKESQISRVKEDNKSDYYHLFIDKFFLTPTSFINGFQQNLDVMMLIDHP
jgi:hypothetical protein